MARTKEEIDEQIAKHHECIKVLEEEAVSVDPWKAESGEDYYYLNYSEGCVDNATEDGFGYDQNRHSIGNYYKTEEEAARGPEAFRFNSNYTYWHTDMPTPTEAPTGCEYFDPSSRKWLDSKEYDSAWSPGLRRWPKTSRVSWS